MKNLSVRNEGSDIPCKSDVDSRLDNVPNVGTNDQTPTYSTATTLAKLVTGEKLGVAFGKIAKAIDELITHLSDSVKHITAAERTDWNSKAAGNHTHLAATQLSADDKKKLDGVASGANAYTHPTTSGNKHIPAGGSSGQILRWSADGTAAWGADNNTTYSNMTAATASAAGKAGLVPAPAAGAQTKYLRGDGTWQTPPDTNTTYSNMTAATASAAGTSGLVPAPAAGKQTSFLRGDGTWVVPTNTTYSNMTAATASAAGKAGLVPAPAAGKQTSFLRGDGTWVVPTNTTYSAATQSAAGLMSAADKKKLDSGYMVLSDSKGLYVEY